MNNTNWSNQLGRYYYTPVSDNTSMRFWKVLRFNNVKITVFFLFFRKKMCK